MDVEYKRTVSVLEHVTGRVLLGERQKLVAPLYFIINTNFHTSNRMIHGSKKYSVQFKDGM